MFESVFCYELTGTGIAWSTGNFVFSFLRNHKLFCVVSVTLSALGFNFPSFSPSASATQITVTPVCENMTSHGVSSFVSLVMSDTVYLFITHFLTFKRHVYASILHSFELVSLCRCSGVTEVKILHIRPSPEKLFANVLFIFCTVF